MNAFEEPQRERKARAIVRYVFAHFALADVMQPDFLEGFAQYPQKQRDYVAAKSGQKSPSAATWEVATRLVREHLEVAALRPRCGAERQAGPFEPVHVCHLPSGHSGYCSSGSHGWPQAIGYRRAV